MASEPLDRPSAVPAFLEVAGVASINLVRRVRAAHGAATMTFSRDEMLEISLAFLRAVELAGTAQREAGVTR